jgi:hypothetical protein
MTIVGLDERGVVPGLPVLDPNSEITSPFAAPTVLPEAVEGDVAGAFGANDLIAAIQAFDAAHHNLVGGGAFHTAPNPSRYWDVIPLYVEETTYETPCPNPEAGCPEEEVVMCSPQSPPQCALEEEPD